MSLKRIPLTQTFNLPGGQERMRAAILYIAERCADMPRFGVTKLNKIIWTADFDAYAERLVPVTGRAYQREAQGPIAVDMKPLLREMERDDLITYKITTFPSGKSERRPVAKVKADMSQFTDDDVKYINAAIEKQKNNTARQASIKSHGVAWETRANGDPMYYELAFLSDAELQGKQRDNLIARAARLGLKSH
jgi:Protein of unknown function (DUF4065)